MKPMKNSSATITRTYMWGYICLPEWKEVFLNPLGAVKSYKTHIQLKQRNYACC